MIKDAKSVGYQVTALDNTWSNQRRKRRDELRKAATCDDAVSSQASSETLEPPLKRAKKESVPLAVIGLILREEGEEPEESNTKVIEINWLQGSGGRESSHQIMQYMKNNV